MEWKFAFGFASEELFFVTTQPSDPKAPGQRQQSSVTTFSDENVFLKLVIAADLGHKKTLALSDRRPGRRLQARLAPGLDQRHPHHQADRSAPSPSHSGAWTGRCPHRRPGRPQSGRLALGDASVL